MKQFYSIVKLSPNVVTEDSVAIGIILFDGFKFWNYFSSRKKNIVSKLLNKKAANISNLIKQIELKCFEINNEDASSKLILNESRMINASYFEYLKNYSNGLLQFSSPNAYSGEMDEGKFNQLVNALFNESRSDNVLAHIPVSNFSNIVESKLISKVKDQVHTNYKLTKKQIPELFFPSFEMDCIGKNGALVGAKSLSFEKSKQTLDTNLGHYFTLISTLSSKFNKPLSENSFYLICEEPQSTSSEEHKLWESVYKNEVINVIDPEESGLIADLMIREKSTTFLD